MKFWHVLQLGHFPENWEVQGNDRKVLAFVYFLEQLLEVEGNSLFLEYMEYGINGTVLFGVRDRSGGEKVKE